MVKIATQINRFFRLLCYLPIGVSALVVLLGILLVCAETVIRYGRLSTVSFADEFSGYVVVLITFLAAADSVRTGTFVRLRFVVNRLPEKAQEILTLAGYIIGLVTISIMLPQAWHMFSLSLEIHSISQTVIRTPLSIPQSFIVIGLIILWLQFLSLVIRASMKAGVKVDGKGG